MINTELQQSIISSIAASDRRKSRLALMQTIFELDVLRDKQLKILGAIMATTGREPENIIPNVSKALGHEVTPEEVKSELIEIKNIVFDKLGGDIAPNKLTSHQNGFIKIVLVPFNLKARGGRTPNHKKRQVSERDIALVQQAPPARIRDNQAAPVEKGEEKYDPLALEILAVIARACHPQIPLTVFMEIAIKGHTIAEVAEAQDVSVGFVTDAFDNALITINSRFDAIGEAVANRWQRILDRNRRSGPQ